MKDIKIIKVVAAHENAADSLERIINDQKKAGYNYKEVLLTYYDNELDELGTLLLFELNPDAFEKVEITEGITERLEPKQEPCNPPEKDTVAECMEKKFEKDWVSFVEGTELIGGEEKLPNNLNKSVVLRMDAKFRPEIERGTKTVTTRKGHRTEFKIGQEYKIEWTHSYEGPVKPTYIRVRRVDFRRMVHIDDKLAELAAHTDAENYKKSIRTYYPHISEQDVVTSVYFKVV